MRKKFLLIAASLLVVTACSKTAEQSPEASVELEQDPLLQDGLDAAIESVDVLLQVK